MTTKQNIARGRQASAYDIARLIVGGLAGQRSAWADPSLWSGREWEAVHRAAEALVPLYEDGLLPDELVARVGRSMLESAALPRLRGPITADPSLPEPFVRLEVDWGDSEAPA